jgi:hypothetical protein
MPMDLEGLEVHWATANPEGPRCHGANIDVQRRERRMDVRAKSLRCRDEHTQLEISSLSFSLGEDGTPSNVKAPAEPPPPEGGPSTHAPWALQLGEVHLTLGDLPAATPLSAPKGVGTRESTHGSGTGTSGASIQPDSVRDVAALNPLASVREAIRRFRDVLTLAREEHRTFFGGLPVGSFVKSERIHVRISKDEQKLDLGPFLLSASREPAKVVVDLRQGVAASQIAFVANATLFTEERRAKTSLSIGPTTLERLGISPGDFGLEDVANTSIQIRAKVDIDSRTPEILIESDGDISNLAFRQPWLSKSNINGLNLTWDGKVDFDPAIGRLRVEGMRLGLGRVSAKLGGSVAFLDSSRQIEGTFEVPLAACQDFFDALPIGLAPLLGRWRVDGTFGLSSRVSYRSDAAEKSSVKLQLDNRCRVTSVPPEVSPRRFDRPFALEVEDASGTTETLSFGPGTWTWTPLSAISPYVESAVLVCEDGRFLRHGGFDLQAIENSIKENLRTSRFARGGSTVSMQLAKNLYLRRDKTLSRKLQEAALTMLLEQSFSKKQLLELYLNVIEYGPGIYGIGPAARHYFDTTPERLSLAQSYFLISLLPNPKATRFGSDGQLFPGWLRQIRSLMGIAAKRGHFSPAELEAALLEQPTFRQPGPPPTIYPTRRITGTLDGPTDEVIDETVRAIDANGG